MNDHLNPIIARALAPFTPPEPSKPCPHDNQNWHNFTIGVCTDCGADLPLSSAPTPVRPSLVIPCPACYGGWRDTPTGVVMCGQCMGTGRRATNQGEP